MVVKNLLFLGGLILLFSGCLPKQDDVKSVFQTNAATIIKKDRQRMQKLLLSFKDKLNKRNPKAYNEEIEHKIQSMIEKDDKKLYLEYRNIVLDDYKSYLQIAFSKDNVIHRNDYLILGLYYLIYDAYNMDSSHKLVAFEYDKEKLKKLHKNLQILKWKIKVDKDVNNNYLFLTWQNNWQVELERKIQNKKDFDHSLISQLYYLNSGGESLFNHSNFSFEVLLTQMIDSVENSLIALGEEPTELTVKALFLFI